MNLDLFDFINSVDVKPFTGDVQRSRCLLPGGDLCVSIILVAVRHHNTIDGVGIHTKAQVGFGVVFKIKGYAGRFAFFCFYNGVVSRINGGCLDLSGLRNRRHICFFLLFACVMACAGNNCVFASISGRHSITRK